MIDKDIVTVRMRSLVAAAGLGLVLAGCASVLPTNPPSPTRSSFTATPSPTAMASPSPTPSLAHQAELTISARGDYRSREECRILIINEGGCQPWLIVDPLGLAHARSWTPYDPSIAFDTRATPWIYAKQSGLTPGTYGVALAIELGSDVPTCLPGQRTPREPGGSCRYAEIVCFAEVEVTPQTERVNVDADYGEPCHLEVKVIPGPTRSP